jgi:biotin operon repressor
MSLIDLASVVQAGGEGRPPRPDEEGELIRRADALVRRSHERLGEIVSDARSRGVSWQAIGDALGVSRQAAFKRFGTTEERGARVEQTTDLLDRTRMVFASLDAGDYGAVRELMTYTCSRALPKRTLMRVWGEVVSESGRLRECGDLTAQTASGSTALGAFANQHLSTGAIVQATLRHEAGDWIGRVAYNGSGRITGILIAPPDARGLPF